MTAKKVTTLVITAALLGGLAYWSSHRGRIKTPSLTGKPVLKSIDLSQVGRIELTTNGKKSLILKGTEAGWTLESLFNYPADITKIRANLLSLTDLKIGQVVREKKLENAILADLQSPEGKSLAILRLGEKHLREAPGEMAMMGGGAFPDGRYVATEGETVYLVKETLDAFDGDIKNWTDTQICAIPGSEIVTAEFKASDETLKLERKNGSWALEGLGPKEELDTSKLYNVDSALSYLNFSSIANPALTEEQIGVTTGAVYTVTLKNGERYTAKVGNTFGADRALKLSATFEPSGTNATENATIKAKVDKFNADVAKWTYLIASSSADNFSKRRADVVKAKEEPKPATDEKKSE
jgi:Domain of unknown function (DUF4340)